MRYKLVLASVCALLVAVASAGCSSTAGQSNVTMAGDNFCSAYIEFELESLRIGRDLSAAGDADKTTLLPLQARLVTAIDNVKSAVPADAPAVAATVFSEMSKVAADDTYKPPLTEAQQKEFMGWMAQECPTIEADLKTAKAALATQSPGAASPSPSS